MYLTKCELNPARRHTRELLGSPQKMHAAVMSSFPPDQSGPDGQGRILWRTDSNEHHRVLFISSPTRPDLTHIVEQAGWPTTGTWQTRDYQPLLNRLETGQRWAFRLTANPVHSVRTKDDQTATKPTAHITVDQQTTWLREREERNGFQIVARADNQPAMTVRDRAVLRFRRQSSTVTISRATYEGLLQITDPDLMRKTLVNGLGRAKAYGCGLLTLAP